MQGGGFQARLRDTAAEAAKLIDTIADHKDCPVSALLTNAGRAKLLQIKRSIEADQAEQKPAPSDAPDAPHPP